MIIKQHLAILTVVLTIYNGNDILTLGVIYV